MGAVDALLSLGAGDTASSSGATGSAPSHGPHRHTHQRIRHQLNVPSRRSSEYSKYSTKVKQKPAIWAPRMLLDQSPPSLEQ